MTQRCAVGLAAALLAAPSARGAEPVDERARRLDDIVVTGTRLRGIDVQGPLPVSVVERAEWEHAGVVSVPDVLRHLPWNSFGNAGEQPNSAEASAAQPQLRGLGSKYTLVLLDGHRLPGYSSFEGGAATNVAGLPLSAIDRIEVLREGASAVYGSDAIGGVINLITRRDAGSRFGLQWDEPDQAGGGTRRANFSTAAQGERSHGVLALEWQDREPLFGAQRDYLLSHTALSNSGDPGSFRRRDPVTRQFIDFFQPDPRCPSALDSDPLFPHSVRVQRGSATFCGYRFRDLNMERAAFRARSLFGGGEFDFGDGLSAFARVMAVDGDTTTQLAPTPVTGVEIAADNPVNPTLGERGPGLGYPVQLSYRTSALGPRVTASDERMRHVLAGLDGPLSWGEGGEWTVHAVSNRQSSDAVARSGYALRGAFTAAIASGAFDPFSALPGDASGLEAARYMPWTRSETRSDGVGASLQFDAAPWRGMGSSHAFGLDLRRDRFDAAADAQTLAAQVLGQGVSPPVQRAADRAYGAVYVESLLHPRESLEINLAARYDQYEDAGSALSPKLALAWRPASTLLVRASAGRGFQAPDLVSAYGGFSTGSALAIDSVGCAAQPGNAVACAPTLLEVSLVPNPQLAPEQARQANIGLAWEAARDLHLSLDYVQTRVRDEIGRLDAQDALANELRCARGEDGCDALRDGQVLRDANGNIESVVLPRINIAGTRVRALDGEATLRHATRAGDVRMTLRASRVLSFERQLQDTLPTETLDGARGRPRWRAQLQLDWQHAEYGATLGAAYTASQRNCLFTRSTDPAANAFCNGDIASHLELDAQVRWQAPWKAGFTLGVRNLADREPAFDADGGFAYGLYDPTGQVFYLGYEHAF